jgi:cyanophycin synthetase
MTEMAERAVSVSAPDPHVEIRMTALHATRGANYWSRRPVTRLDITTGAYEDLSSAHVPGVTASLVAAMPGLVEHRCSIGERGGFITRLRRGTYAPTSSSTLRSSCRASSATTWGTVARAAETSTANTRSCSST